MKKNRISGYGVEVQPNKIVLGIRCQPDLVSQIDTRAELLGISRSAYAETLLVTSEANRSRIEGLEGELSKVKRDLFRATSKIDKLEAQISEQHSMLEIFDEPKLLALFDKLNGTTDVIKSPDGESIAVSYNTPKDVLMAMIYCFKLKK